MATSWHPSLADVPEGPAIIIANEFFDALPVSQAVKTKSGWHERQVEVDGGGHLGFTAAPDPLPGFEALLPPAVRAAPVGSIFEWRSEIEAMELGRRLARDGGAALVIDYGHAESAPGDTLQAVGRHVYADVLGAPGRVDLTAHVDFQALKRAVEVDGRRGLRADHARAIAAPPRHRNARGQAQGARRAACRRRNRRGVRTADRTRTRRNGRPVQGRRIRPSGTRSCRPRSKPNPAYGQR